ncbi:MAG TPA: hypothetical protein VM432_12300 [Bdellovibrionales bacterium]|nr:hypothetical protein [Bdellovibrionales bacterium]
MISRLMICTMFAAGFLVAGCATPQNEAFRIPKEDAQTALMETEPGDRQVAQEQEEGPGAKPTVLPKKKQTSKKSQ